MLTDANLCLTRQRLAQFGLQLVVGRPEGWVRLDNTRGGGAENRLQISHLGPASPLGGTESSDKYADLEATAKAAGGKATPAGPLKKRFKRPLR